MKRNFCLYLLTHYFLLYLTFSENCASGSLFDRLKSLIGGALRIEPTEAEMSVEWLQINNQLSLITNCITTATKSLLYYM